MRVFDCWDFATLLDGKLAMRFLLYLLWIVFPFWALLQTIAKAEEKSHVFSVVENSEGLTVLEGIRPLLTFQKTIRSQNGRWPRSNYVHPIYDLNGEVLTEDFPVDHGHHRGVFWAWHQVQVDGKQLGDAWTCQDFEWNVRELTAETNSEKAIIRTVTDWQSPEMVDSDGRQIPFASEQVAITVHALATDRRMIDFEIQLRALVDNVQIGGSDDAKGYGGFSPRIKLSEDMLFVAAGGEVEPSTNAIAAGAWINIANSRHGVAMLSHPDNPRAAEQAEADSPDLVSGQPTVGESGQMWILRRSRSMQNAVFPGRQPIPLSRFQPLVLRYRLVLHGGELEISEFHRMFQEYATSD